MNLEDQVHFSHATIKNWIDSGGRFGGKGSFWTGLRKKMTSGKKTCYLRHVHPISSLVAIAKKGFKDSLRWEKRY